MKDFEAKTLLELFQLKHLNRSGWMRVGIERPESVASHSWGMTLLALLRCPEHLDQLKVLKLAIVHDMPEVECGDITPHDGVCKTEKQRLEQNAATRLLKGEMYDLWCEYRDNISPESQYVHRLDKLDMYLQALVYQSLSDTTEFIESATKGLEPQDIDWIENILS